MNMWICLFNYRCVSVSTTISFNEESPLSAEQKQSSLRRWKTNCNMKRECIAEYNLITQPGPDPGGGGESAVHSVMVRGGGWSLRVRESFGTVLFNNTIYK